MSPPRLFATTLTHTLTCLAGLDVHQRPRLLRLLHDLHIQENPLIVLGLRQHDPIPDWVTNVAIAREDGVLSGPREELTEAIIKATTAENTPAAAKKRAGSSESPKDAVSAANVLVKVEGLNIAYSDRKVCGALLEPTIMPVFSNYHYLHTQGSEQRQLDHSRRRPMAALRSKRYPLSSYQLSSPLPD